MKCHLDSNHGHYRHSNFVGTDRSILMRPNQQPTRDAKDLRLHRWPYCGTEARLGGRFEGRGTSENWGGSGCNGQVEDVIASFASIPLAIHLLATRWLAYLPTRPLVDLSTCAFAGMLKATPNRLFALFSTRPTDIYHYHWPRV